MKQDAAEIIGTIRRFGKKGVLYEVLDYCDEDNILIRVLDTGEETSYPIADALQDPEE